MKYDLGFGNSVCVRQAFLDTYRNDMLVFTSDTLGKLDYPNHDGDPELVEITKKIIKRQTKRDYRHVFLTNGATGAVTIALRAYAHRGLALCHTRKAPWYMNYPSMIRSAGLDHVDETHSIWQDLSVILLDVPSNPLGLSSNWKTNMSAPTVLDGVYFSRVYMSGSFITTPPHDVLAGSYSKLLGINGIRVGWLATNDDLLAVRLRDLVTGEYCGISAPSTEILKRTLFQFDWDMFESRAKSNLNANREQWTKLEKFFGNSPVARDGMFYYGPVDQKCKKLLDKSNIIWTPGSKMGTDDSWGRFNLGADNDKLHEAVVTIIRNDKIK